MNDLKCGGWMADVHNEFDFDLSWCHLEWTGGASRLLNVLNQAKNICFVEFHTTKCNRQQKLAVASAPVSL